MKYAVKLLCCGAFVMSSIAGSGSVAAESKKQENRCDKYALVLGTYTWSQARSDAMERSGRLATVSSIEESACVAQALNNETAWIGGSDAQNEGEWRWDVPKNGLFWKGGGDGQAFGFANWNGGEPNNSGNEDCALAFGSEATWNDGPCSNGYPYVIRYP